METSQPDSLNSDDRSREDVERSRADKRRREAAWRRRLMELPPSRSPARRSSIIDDLRGSIALGMSYSPNEHEPRDLTKDHRRDLESDLRIGFGLLWSTATLKENLASELLAFAGCRRPQTDAQRIAAYKALYAESQVLLESQNAKVDESEAAARLCSAVHRALSSYPQDARPSRSGGR